MKHLKFIANIFLSASACAVVASHSYNEKSLISNNGNVLNNTNIESNTMKITVGSSVFSATLYDNASANAFKAKLPLTITMRDLNNNEKAYNFSDTLPTNAAVGGNIHTGDLMLYGNNCLVLFYENFTSTYSYSKLGKINDVAGLTAAIGTGSIRVTFELN